MDGFITRVPGKYLTQHSHRSTTIELSRFLAWPLHKHPLCRHLSSHQNQSRKCTTVNMTYHSPLRCSHPLYRLSGESNWRRTLCGKVKEVRGTEGGKPGRGNGGLYAPGRGALPSERCGSETTPAHMEGVDQPQRSK